MVTPCIILYLCSDLSQGISLFNVHFCFDLSFYFNCLSLYRQRFETAEKEYIESKIDFQKKQDLKDQLTEHLFVIIQKVLYFCFWFFIFSNNKLYYNQSYETTFYTHEIQCFTLASLSLLIFILSKNIANRLILSWNFFYIRNVFKLEKVVLLVSDLNWLQQEARSFCCQSDSKITITFFCYLIDCKVSIPNLISHTDRREESIKTGWTSSKNRRR